MRVIQGDGVSYETLEAILANMKKHKWSAGEWESWGGVAPQGHEGCEGCGGCEIHRGTVCV